VVSGHSHQPRIGALNGVVYLNPGSAGPRRFRLPVTLARMTIERDAIDVRVIDLVSMREFCTPWISTASTTSS
jgi:predicted phosphodiesterase